MTYQQPPSQPIGYYPVPPARPTSVTVLAIIGIIFASMGLLGGICGGLSLILSSVAEAVQAEMSDVEVAIDNSLTWKVYSVFSIVTGFAMAALLMYGSIGSLKLKAPAHKAMLLYAWLAIGFAILGMIMTLAVLLPLLNPYFSSSDPAEVGAAWGGLIGGVLGSLIGVIYPFFVLLFYCKPHVLAAFGLGEAANRYQQQPYQPYGSQPPYPQQ